MNRRPAGTQDEHWASALQRCQQNGEPHVLATVIAASGSTPRAAGTKMLVTAETSVASLGGGGIEHLVLRRARELLRGAGDCQEIKQFALGAEARQCCGGSMTVLLECFAAGQAQLVIFGAGHVCRALARILPALPLRVTVVDSRAEQLDLVAALAPEFTLLQARDPLATCAELPSGAEFLVMTHDHQLDYALVRHLLEHFDAARVGMIGSATKAGRFRMRLRNDGCSDAELERFVSPIGLEGLKGKLPMEVAVSVLADYLLRLQRGDGTGHQSWRELRALVPASVINGGRAGS